MVRPASRAPYHSAFPLWCACRNQGTELGQGKCSGLQGDAQSLPVLPAWATSTWLQASVSLLESVPATGWSSLGCWGTAGMGV